MYSAKVMDHFEHPDVYKRQVLCICPHGRQKNRDAQAGRRDDW